MGQTTVEVSFETLRMALPLMSKHKIPVTRENYWVWYQYISGENEPLKESRDRSLEKNQSINSETTAALHRRYVQSADQERLISAEDTIRKLVDGMGTSLDSADFEVSKYEASLDECAEELSEDLSADRFKSLVGVLSESTKRMHEGSANLHSHLDQSREEMKLLKEELKRAKAQAKTDPMTALANRTGFKESLDALRDEEEHRAATHSLLIADIDKFKNINEPYGHIFGDKIIKVVAKALEKLTKGKDIAARFGGEEFVVVLPGTNIKGGVVVSESIRQNLENGRVFNPKTKEEIQRVTISIGVTTFNLNEDIEAVIERADAALYRAKEGGRKRVEVGEVVPAMQAVGG
jgi:diguanylate cyclase